MQHEHVLAWVEHRHRLDAGGRVYPGMYVISKGVEMTDELKPCPYCGHEPDSRISDTDGNKYYTCGSKWCRNGNWYTLEEWNTRPIEDALQARIAELEAENKALKLIANSHSMSELRRNQILAGDKWYKYPPAPERKEQ